MSDGKIIRTNGEWKDEDDWDDKTLKCLWEKIYENYVEPHPEETDIIDMSVKSQKREIAMELIKKHGWPWRKNYSSRKYLFSLGMIIDYLNASEENKLWTKNLELVYILPRKAPDKVNRKKRDIKISYIELLDNKCLQSKNDPLATCIKEAFNEIFEKSEWRKANHL